MIRASIGSAIIEPGFFSSSPVQVALIVGSVAAVVSGVVGVFTVVRGQSFAGHSLADTGTAGGSVAFLLGVSPLYGFIVMNLIVAGVMELIGIRRPRGRDVATGIVLGAALGLAALFLYFDTTSTSTTGATINVLFGSIFTLPSSMVPVIVVLSALAIGVTLFLYRPLIPQLSQCRPRRCPRRLAPTRRDRLPRRPGTCRVAFRDNDRGDPLDCPPHRSGRNRPATHEANRGRRRDCCRHRRWRDVARRPPRLRQLLLDVLTPGVAGQLLRRDGGLRLLPGRWASPPDIGRRLDAPLDEGLC